MNPKFGDTSLVLGTCELGEISPPVSWDPALSMGSAPTPLDLGPPMLQDGPQLPRMEFPNPITDEYLQGRYPTENKIDGTPYVGLRPVFSKLPEVIAGALVKCREENAWPNWADALEKAVSLRWNMQRFCRVLQEAITLSQWTQTVDEILNEIPARLARTVVFQNTPPGGVVVDCREEIRLKELVCG